MKGGDRESAGRSVLAPGAQIWHRHFAGDVPTFIRSARGPMLVTEDGRELIDLYCGSGTVILGHADPEQLAAVQRGLGSGATVSLRHRTEEDVARRLLRLIRGMDRVAFFKTGSEAVHAALMLAVRVTGRELVLTTGYHGWLHPLVAIKNRRAAVDVCPLSWDSPTLLRDCKRLLPQSACLIISPSTVMPVGPDLTVIAELARASGAIIVADEVKAGFRRAFPTTTQQMGVVPDLVVVSKALANGFPLAALCGNETLLGDPQLFNVFSTYASELVSMTAARACLDQLEGGAYDRFRAASSALYDGLARVCPEFGLQLQGVSTFFRLELPPHISADELCHGMYARGALFHPRDEVLISAAHTTEHVEAVVDALVATLSAIAR